MFSKILLGISLCIIFKVLVDLYLNKKNPNHKGSNQQFDFDVKSEDIKKGFNILINVVSFILFILVAMVLASIYTGRY